MKNQNPEPAQWWCAYCKEPIKVDNGFVVKKGKTYHIDCYKLLTEQEDDFGDPIPEDEII